jgi:hypothetical protein
MDQLFLYYALYIVSKLAAPAQAHPQLTLSSPEQPEHLILLVLPSCVLANHA